MFKYKKYFFCVFLILIVFYGTTAIAINFSESLSNSGRSGWDFTNQKKTDCSYKLQLPTGGSETELPQFFLVVDGEVPLPWDPHKPITLSPWEHAQLVVKLNSEEQKELWSTAKLEVRDDDDQESLTPKMSKMDLGSSSSEEADDEGDDPKKLQKVKKKHVKRYKKRLLVGEGDFSYTVALLCKHPELYRSLIATEYDSDDKLAKKHEHFKENISFLKGLDVKVLCEVNGKKLHEHGELKKIRFKRIHFNCPYFGSRDDAANRELVEKFFLSARELQQSGDRIHIVLPKPKDEYERKRREGLVYNIYSACTQAGYLYIKKRKFIEIGESDTLAKRYPRYGHVMTKGYGSASIMDEGGREYIFEKKKSLPNLEEVKTIADDIKEFNRGMNKLEKILMQRKTCEDDIRKTAQDFERFQTLHKISVEKEKWEQGLLDEFSQLKYKNDPELKDHNKKYKKLIQDLKVCKERLEKQLEGIEKPENLEKQLAEIKGKRDEYIHNRYDFLFKLITEITEHGLKSKIFFGALIPQGDEADYCTKSGCRYGDLKAKILFEDGLDFLLSQPLILYSCRDYTNRAFYPLPELTTDPESSDYVDDGDIDDDLLIGPPSIPGWELHDTHPNGNCFYEAVADQLQFNRYFIEGINPPPHGTEIHDILRLLTQRILGEEFIDGVWAGYPEIAALIRTYTIVIAIVDTRYPLNGFVYHYINESDDLDFTIDINRLPKNRPIMRLAYTGDHYLSVHNFPNSSTMQSEQNITHIPPQVLMQTVISFVMHQQK